MLASAGSARQIEQITWTTRTRNYVTQRGTEEMTSQQQRRAARKLNHALNEHKPAKPARTWTFGWGVPDPDLAGTANTVMQKTIRAQAALTRLRKLTGKNRGRRAR